MQFIVVRNYTRQSFVPATILSPVTRYTLRFQLISWKRTINYPLIFNLITCTIFIQQKYPCPFEENLYFPAQMRIFYAMIKIVRENERSRRRRETASSLRWRKKKEKIVRNDIGKREENLNYTRCIWFYDKVNRSERRKGCRIKSLVSSRGSLARGAIIVKVFPHSERVRNGMSQLRVSYE